MNSYESVMDWLTEIADELRIDTAIESTKQELESLNDSEITVDLDNLQWRM